MEMSDFVLMMSLVISCCAVVLLGIQAPLQRHALREIADRTRLDMITMIDEVGTLQMRLDALDRAMKRLVQRVDQLQLSGGKSETGYGQAATLARAGASAEQLIEQCGITRGEADLLRRLNAA